MPRKSTEHYDFCFYHRLIIAGLIVAEDVEIEGRAHFTFSPGRPARGPSYACGGEPAEDPEIEIDSIFVFGHPTDAPNAKGVYAELPSSDPLWKTISDWLLKDKFSEMADAVGDPMEDYADYMNDRARDERLTAAE